MSITYLLVVLGLGILGVAVAALFWAADSGQFDDLEAQGRIVLDDEAAPQAVEARAPGADASRSAINAGSTGFVR